MQQKALRVSFSRNVGGSTAPADVLDAMEKLDDRQVLPNFYCEANDLLYLPTAVPARLVSVEMLNLSDKIDQLQKEVGWSIAEMNDSIKSLSAKQYQQLQTVIRHEL